ncbi:1634_t:CDS:1, partial [Funneliformis geosporum]
MADAIINILNKYGLRKKALALITDNASAMIVCGKYLSDELELEFDNFAFFHYRYSAHVLNLAISKGIELIDDSIIKVQNLILYIKASSIVNEALKKLCSVKNIKYLTLEIDIKT